MVNTSRFQYFAALPNCHLSDWPSDLDLEHVLFKDDLENPALLRTKLRTPDSVPRAEAICPEVQRLQLAIEARYIGLASFISHKTPQGPASLKTPSEGMQMQKKMLEQITKEYSKVPEKVFRMGTEQNLIFSSGLLNYCNFGGHGSGACIYPS